MKDKYILIIFLILLVPFLFLLAYKTAVIITPLTDSQQLVFNFLSDPVTYEKSLVSYGATELEVSHLYDVINVMNFLDVIFYLTLLFGTLILTLKKKNKEIVQKMLLYGGISTIITPIILGLATLISFDRVFTLFHSILFPQGNWQFPYESFIIVTFPLQFFITITIKILVITIIYASIFIGLSLFLKHVTKSTRN